MLGRLAPAIVTSFVAISAVAQEPTQIAVLPVNLDTSAKTLPAVTIDEIVLTAVEKAGDFKVIGQSDIAALLNFEKQKDMLGCDDQTCMAEIGGALGVDKLLAVTVSRIHPNWVVSIKVIDTSTNEVKRESPSFIPGDANAFLQALPVAVTKALGGKISDVAFGGGVQITVPRVNVSAVGGSGMSNINLEAEKALDDAMAVEENPSATPEDRVRVWCKLGEIAGNNPYVKQARAGCQSWRKYIEDRRKLRSALAKDYETLIGYLELRRPAEQKVAVVDSFLNAYGSVSDDARVAAVAAVRDRVAAGEKVSLTADRDGDGVSDANDRCPDEAGTEEAGGCRPVDSDGDGIFDALDKCPTEPEDKDGFNDSDGCADKDNDGDGVPDASDKCPTEQEDHKGDRRNPDGCPGTMAGLAVLDGHPEGTYIIAFVGKGFGDDDFDAATQWGVGIGMMDNGFNLTAHVRFGTGERDWDPDDTSNDPSSLLAFDFNFDAVVISFPRADDAFFSPVNLIVGAGLSMGGSSDLSSDMFFSLTPSIANFVILASTFRVGARFAYPIGLSGEYSEPPRFTAEAGVGF